MKSQIELESQTSDSNQKRVFSVVKDCSSVERLENGFESEAMCTLHSINIVSFSDFVRKNKLSNSPGCYNEKTEENIRSSLE